MLTFLIQLHSEMTKLFEVQCYFGLYGCGRVKEVTCSVISLNTVKSVLSGHSKSQNKKFIDK